MRPRTVIFDLDGTLVDSWAVHRRCLRQACAATGRPVPSAAALTLAQRPTDLDTLAVLVGPADAKAALTAYHDALARDLAGEPVASMPGAVAALRTLVQAGINVGVCTGRSRVGASALLEAAGLSIALLVAREDAPVPKPAPDGLWLAVARAGGTNRTTVYIGDTLADAQQGCAAGVPSVLLGRAAAGCVLAVDSLGDLPGLLKVWEETG